MYLEISVATMSMAMRLKLQEKAKKIANTVESRIHEIRYIQMLKTVQLEPETMSTLKILIKFFSTGIKLYE